MNQATHVTVVDSTPARLRQGLPGRITSVLTSPMTASASALSYELPNLPTDGSIPASERRSVHRMQVQGAAVAMIDQARYTKLARVERAADLLPCP